MHALELHQWPITPPGFERPIAALSLSLKEGQAAALVGGSGSGKTTALRQLSLLLAGPDFALWGQPPQRGLVHFLPDRPGLCGELTGEESAEELLALHGLSLDKAQLQKWASLLEIEELVGRKNAKLSRGEAARVALLRVLLLPAGLLLLDEPTAHLDGGLRQKVRAALVQWGSEGARRAVLMSTHHPDDAADLPQWQLERA